MVVEAKCIGAQTKPKPMVNGETTPIPPSPTKQNPTKFNWDDFNTMQDVWDTDFLYMDI